MISVLYVDDEPGLLEIARIFLEASGEFAVTTTTSARKSLELLSTQSYDAIISDYQMPEMDGIALLKTVREKYDDIPFILFTGRGREEVVIDAINNGADFYLQKGGDVKAQFAELMHKIRQAVRRRTTERELRRNEARLRSFVETTRESVSLVDEEGKVLEWNAATERITGIRKEEAVGSYIWDLTFRMLPGEQHTEERRELIEQRIRASLKTGIPVFGEPRVIESEDPDGSRTFTRQTVFPIKTDKGFGIGSISQDITKEKLAENALRESERKYRDLAELLPQVVFEADARGNLQYTNRIAFQYFRYTEEDFKKGLNIMQMLAPGDVERAGAAFRALVEGKGRIAGESNEYTALRKDGTTFPIAVYPVPILVNGRITGLRGVIVDITERTATQSALQAVVGSMVGTTGLNSLQKIAETVSTWLGVDCVMVGEIQPDHDTVKVLSMILDGKQVNDFIYHLKGTPCENVAEKGFCHYPNDSVRRFPDAKDIIELNIQGYVGTPLWNSQGKVSGILCALSRKPIQLSPSVREILDIIAVKAAAEVERIRIERELRDNEEKFRSFVENANDIVFSMNREGVFTYVSPKCTELLGYETRELIGKPAADLIHPDDFPRNREYFLQTLTTGKKTSGLEYRIRHKNGTWQWHVQNGSPLVDSAGNIVAYLGISHDITDRKWAEAELQKSQYFLSEALDMAHMADWEFDVPTGIFTFNDRFYALYGTTAEREGGYQMAAEVYAREFLHPEDQYIVGEEIAKALSTPETGYFALREHRIIRRDGEVRDIVVHIRVTKVAEGRIIKTHGANQDITDRKKMEEAIRQANKKLSLLSSITRHDINNQLMALNGYLVLLQKEVSGPTSDRFFPRITTASRNIADMIEFTKEYEMIGTVAPVWQDLASTIHAGGKGIIPDQITLFSDLPDGTEIYADPMLEKVFFNLLDNAVRHGERVTQIHISSRPAGGNLVIVWEDNGVGIAADEKERIFERGFGKNTGLGMFLVREILSLTGISIAETGEQGRGARFEMTVPHGSFR